MKKFVLSASEFDNIKSAEEQVEDWQRNGTLKENTKLYVVTEVYDLKLKFTKRKEAKCQK
jgi:hypothetical protein